MDAGLFSVPRWDAAGQCYWGKGVCCSAPFLQAQTLDKGKFFPLMLFDCCALVSTFLWRELVGICFGWHLALGSRLVVF